MNPIVSLHSIARTLPRFHADRASQLPAAPLAPKPPSRGSSLAGSGSGLEQSMDEGCRTACAFCACRVVSVCVPVHLTCARAIGGTLRIAHAQPLIGACLVLSVLVLVLGPCCPSTFRLPAALITHGYGVLHHDSLPVPAQVQVHTCAAQSNPIHPIPSHPIQFRYLLPDSHPSASPPRPRFFPLLFPQP